jgi:hypothetical protein
VMALTPLVVFPPNSEVGSGIGKLYNLFSLFLSSLFGMQPRGEGKKVEEFTEPNAHFGVRREIVGLGGTNVRFPSKKTVSLPFRPKFLGNCQAPRGPTPLGLVGASYRPRPAATGLPPCATTPPRW